MLPDIFQIWYHVEPEILCERWFPRENKTVQVPSMSLQELIDGILRQGVGVTDVESLKTRKLAHHHHFP